MGENCRGISKAYTVEKKCVPYAAKARKSVTLPLWNKADEEGAKLGVQGQR